jgi:hypothetical protein
MKKNGTVNILWCKSHIPPCDHSTTCFQAHPWLCVLVVCCVLRACAVLLGSNAYCIKKLANHGKFGIAGKVFLRQTNLSHLIKVNL